MARPGKLGRSIPYCAFGTMTARLAALIPDTHNVRPKISQQLQVLRDRGWLEFTARRGTYWRTHRN